MKRIVETSRSDPMVACYIDSSYPALLFFAYKYADNVEAAILANANAGGENVARGSLLGALVGAAHGIVGFPKWSFGLKEQTTIQQEIEQFVHPPAAAVDSISNSVEEVVTN
jgi:ADP-ribosylglycohydrolase